MLGKWEKWRKPVLSGKLTDVFLKNLKARIAKDPPPDEFDLREAHGFGIRVRKTGVITFFYMYHFNGKRRFLNLGPYAPPQELIPPNISLADARQKYSTAFAKAKSGIDPLVPPPEPRPEPKVLTVKDLIPLYVEHIKTYLVPLSVRQQQRALEYDMLPVWRHQPIKEILRPDAIKLIEFIQKRAPGQARNVKKAAQSMFDYAEARGYVEFNPFAGVQKHVPAIAPRTGDRWLSDEEIKIVWENSKDIEIGRAILLMLVTGQRPGEVTGMTWSEIDGEWWQISWKRIKTEINPNLKREPRDHRVYLTPLALSLLPIKTDDVYIFPANGRGRSVGAVGGMRPGTISHYLTEGQDNKYFGLPRWTPKDLRRTVRTGLSRLGVPERHAEAVLNHTQSGVKKVYDLYEYDKEKKRALIKWAKHLESLIKSGT